jgi:hypothetical protein
MDKQLKYKTESDKIIDQLKNPKLKGLTHEQLESREKHLESLFRSTIRLNDVEYTQFVLAFGVHVFLLMASDESTTLNI